MNTHIKGRDNCIFCKGKGQVSGSWGNLVLCSCVIEMQNEAEAQQYISPIEEDNAEIEKTTSDIPALLQMAVNNGALTKADIDLEYSRAYASKSLSEKCEMLHLVISRKAVTDCLDTLDLILTDLRLNKRLPDRSYAIGAETGIGKTTFAVTALKYAATAGYNIVPCTDMSTLAEKYFEYSKQMRIQYNKLVTGNKLEEEQDKKEFTWNDYVKADLAIVSLTGGDENTAYVELFTLLQLLIRRGMVNKPTIVLMRTNVDYYAHFEEARKILKELFAIKGKQGTYQLLELHTMFTREPKVG